MEREVQCMQRGRLQAPSADVIFLARDTKRRKVPTMLIPKLQGVMKRGQNNFEGIFGKGNN